MNTNSGNALVLANGFLPSRASFTLDLVFVSLFVVLAAMAYSIYIARFYRQYRQHRTIQIVLSILLLVVIATFEIDLRLFNDWRALAEDSPFYDSGAVDVWLWVHLVFAVPTPFVWIYVLIQAIRHFGWDPKPGPYSRRHRISARIAAGLLFMTAMTGWLFYWIAFVA